MDRRLKTWELALMFGILVAAAAASWLGQEQRELADSVIRLHVIANSDSEADQALKLAVRDRVLEQAEGLYPQEATTTLWPPSSQPAGFPPRSMRALPSPPGITPPYG